MQNGKLYTIGYGNRSQEEFYLLLSANHIDILIDIRSKPYSRFRPQFNKNRLIEFFSISKIEYVFKGEELGGLILEERTDQKQLYIQGINFLVENLKSDHNIAIMCCESDFKKCHRYGIAEDISKEGFDVIHIGKKDELILHKRLF